MLKISKIIAIILVALVIFMFATTTPKIAQSEYLTLQKSSAEFILLDVRSKEEFDKSHIANAINVSYDDIENNLERLLPYKDQKVIVYCRSGRRADVAEDILTDHGFSNVWHLAGDMNAWQAAGLPVVSNEENISAIEEIN